MCCSLDDYQRCCLTSFFFFLSFSLRSQCSGEEMGDIQEYESYDRKADEDEQHESKSEEYEPQESNDEF